VPDRVRCAWCGDDPLYVAYHDREWGVPSRDDRYLFEKLLLDGAQAGLSWLTILRKREGYRRAFCGFDPERVARFTADDQARLLADAGIVRNRRKIASAVRNARAFLDLVEHEGSFATWLWDFVDGRPVQNAWPSVEALPAATPLSRRVSGELKRRGFSFVGPTIIYAWLQAVGVVNDHVVGCFRWREVQEEA
jgi:DNA-3-methyladenine glycosylase I